MGCAETISPVTVCHLPEMHERQLWYIPYKV